MNIEKTNAIILRTFPYSKTSQIITCISEDGNLLSLMAKGAYRPKSYFLGQFDLFYTCEILYYKGKNDNLHLLKEIYPINTRANFRTNWRAANLASWFSLLINHTAIFPQASLYHLLEESLDILDTKLYPSPLILPRFELNLLKILGLTPNFSLPCNCNIENQTTHKFCISEGRILCQCHDSATESPGIPISKEVILLAKDILNHNIKKDYNKNTIISLNRLLGVFLNYHIEYLKILGRDIVIKNQ